MLKDGKHIILLIALAWPNLNARADSCFFLANRIHLGIDVTDPFKMMLADGKQVFTVEAMAKVVVGGGADVLFTGGYHEQTMSGFPPGQYNNNSWWLSAGVIIKQGKRPDKSFFHFEYGPVILVNQTRFDFLGIVTDHFGMSLQVSDRETYSFLALYWQSACVVNLFNRFRVRPYFDLGRVMGNVPEKITDVPGLGAVHQTSQICARGGVAVFINIFSRTGCNQTGPMEREHTYR